MQCPPGIICNANGMTDPCSYSDLPTSYLPIVNYHGNPSEEYFYSTLSKKIYYTEFQCLLLNNGYATGTMTESSQSFFFGELVPPYIDVLGRGANFRATDPYHTVYQSTAKCYMNSQRHGSQIYQRISNYYGPQYDIQYQEDSQGYSRMFSNGSYYYSGFFGPGSLVIDLPYARTFEPSYNCTPGFRLMNESTVLYNAAGLESTVYTDPDHDPYNSVSREIKQGIDQYYPGTCEADKICYQVSSHQVSSQKSNSTDVTNTILTQIITQSIPCPEGYVCDERTNSTNGMYYPCRGGYVCDSSTTPDPSILSPKGQFSKLCPAGYVCNDGTGLGQMYQNICPANYYCPTGTVDYITGELAGDCKKTAKCKSQNVKIL